MSRSAIEWELRRELLEAQCALQRQQLKHAMNAIGTELQPIDRGLSVIRRIRISPALLAGGAALAMGLGSVRAIGGVGRAWLVINSLKRVWDMVQSLRGNAASEPGSGAVPTRRQRKKLDAAAESHRLFVETQKGLVSEP